MNLGLSNSSKELNDCLAQLEVACDDDSLTLKVAVDRPVGERYVWLPL